MTVLIVQLEQLVVLDDLYPRGSVDSERVAVFAEVLRENPSALPPIRAAHVGGIGGYVISDGVHRLHAHRKIGTERTAVEVWGAADTGAVYLDALRTATESAAPLTRAEKREAVARLLAEGHGQREIGRLLGIPQSTVNDWVTGSGHPARNARSNGRSLTKVERVASQLARAVAAVIRAAEEEEEEDHLIAAVIEALGPDGVELLVVLSDAVSEEVAPA